jgi:hypothetical protein
VPGPHFLLPIRHGDFLDEEAAPVHQLPTLRIVRGWDGPLGLPVNAAWRH